MRDARSACRSARLAAGAFVLALWLSGCAILLPQTTELRQGRPAGLPERVELKEVPFFPQSDYQCGPAALATALAHFRVKVTPEELVDQVYLPQRHGSLQVEMLAAARRHGMVSFQLAPRFEDVLREIAAGNPVIILQDYGVWPFSIWHYAVAVGYDYANGEMVLRSGVKQRLTMPFGVFEYLWKESDYWSMVTVPPERIPATASEAGFLAAVMAMDRVGNARSARTAYQAFVDRWPDDLTAMIGLANSHHALGELRDAEAVLRRAADRHPDSAVALNNLAQTLSDQGRDAEALPLAERAVTLGGPFAEAARETRDAILSRMRPR